MLNKIAKLALGLPLLSVLFTLGCSAQQTEEQALQSLRQMTSSGKLPPEDFVANLETRFAGKKTGALAKLLRARIRLEQKDFAGAAAVLNSDVFKKQTGLNDYALWVRGKALQSAGNHGEAINVLGQLVREHPDSIRFRDAKLLWAESAIAAGRAVEVPPMLIDLQDVKDPNGPLYTRVFLLIAKAYETQGSKEEAAENYFLALAWASTKERDEISAKLKSLGTTLHSSSHPGNEDYQKLLRLADLYFPHANMERPPQLTRSIFEISARHTCGISSATREVTYKFRWHRGGSADIALDRCSPAQRGSISRTGPRIRKSKAMADAAFDG